MNRFFEFFLIISLTVAGCGKSKDSTGASDGGDSGDTDTALSTDTSSAPTSDSYSDGLPTDTGSDSDVDAGDAGDGGEFQGVCEYTAPCTGPIPSERQICLYSLTPVLDGNLDDEAWGLANWEQVDATMGPTPGDSNEDVSYEFACVADESFMYFAFRVKDDVINSGESPGCDVYQDDSIEFYVDQCYERADYYDGDDAQIIVGAENIGITESSDILIGGCYQSIEGTETGSSVRAVRNQDGWSGEMAVPLSLATSDGEGWQIDPVAGLIIGFQTHYNDDDDGDGRDSKLIWSLNDRDQDGSWDNPQLFGELQFCPLAEPDAGVDGGMNPDTDTDTVTDTHPEIATDSETASDTVPPTDSETASDTVPPTDSETMSETETPTDSESATDTVTAEDSETVYDTDTATDTSDTDTSDTEIVGDAGDV